MVKLQTAASKNEKITRNQGEEATNTILKHLARHMIESMGPRCRNLAASDASLGEAGDRAGVGNLAGGNQPGLSKTTVAFE